MPCAGSEYAGIYLHARYYDPRLGIFLSPDPIGVEGGTNLYGYGLGDPINSSDRSGLGPNGPPNIPLWLPKLIWDILDRDDPDPSCNIFTCRPDLRHPRPSGGGDGSHAVPRGSGADPIDSPVPPTPGPGGEPPPGPPVETPGPSSAIAKTAFASDPLYYSAQFCAAWGDTLSLGATCGIRELAGINDVIDPSSDAYTYGDYFGTAVGFSLGGAQVARGALAMGGRSGGLGVRFARGLGRLVRDPRQYPTVRRQYWAARGGAGPTRTLHHWWRPQRLGGSNAGWNLLETPRWLNSRMGPPGPWRAAEWAIRGMPLSLVGGAAQGGYWGVYRDQWIAGFE